MSSELGNQLKLQIFGQSHSPAIGAVIDGFPAGLKPDMAKIQSFMARRAPGKADFSTKRRETDEFELLSGFCDDADGRAVTTGDPICAVISNTDVKSRDYSMLKRIPRPSHADLAAYIQRNGFNDIRGGGHFSGRLTAPLCFAGALCVQLLESKLGIRIAAHIYSIADVSDQPFDPTDIPDELCSQLSSMDFAVINRERGQLMRDRIKQAADSLDSVGGVIECAINNVPCGFGSPMFGGIENELSRAVFGIPAIKGIEFGAGFAAAMMTGSTHNDEFFFDTDGNVKTRTNNHGGILGGITSGMPIIFRTAIKPTPSIARKQSSVDLAEKRDAELSIVGRHDPCIVPRAVAAVEAAAAFVIADILKSELK